MSAIPDAFHLLAVAKAAEAQFIRINGKRSGFGIDPEPSELEDALAALDAAYPEWRAWS